MSELNRPYAFRPNASHKNRAIRNLSPPETKLRHTLLISDTLAEARQMASVMGWDVRALEYAVEQFAVKLKAGYMAFDPDAFVAQYHDDIGAALDPPRIDGTVFKPE